MVHSVSGWTRGVQVKLCEIPWQRVPYMSAIVVCSRQGAIQIHVYLYFYLISVFLIHVFFARAVYTDRSNHPSAAIHSPTSRSETHLFHKPFPSQTAGTWDIIFGLPVLRDFSIVLQQLIVCLPPISRLSRQLLEGSLWLLYWKLARRKEISKRMIDHRHHYRHQ